MRKLNKPRFVCDDPRVCSSKLANKVCSGKHILGEKCNIYGGFIFLEGELLNLFCRFLLRGIRNAENR